jgi:hypothetical protein
VTEDHSPAPVGRPPASQEPGAGPGPTRVTAVPRDAEPWPLVAIDRAFSFLRGVGRSALRLAGMALLGGVLVWWALWRGLDAGEDRTVALVVVGILLLAPPVVLTLFVVAVRALADVPRRVREAPADFRERATEIRRRVGELRNARSRSLGSLFALWRAGASWRELFEVVSPALFLLTPGMLIASVLAAPAAVLEILAGAIAVVWLALG